MTVVIPFCQKDVREAIRLLEWIVRLGTLPEYPALLVGDAATDWRDSKEMVEAAQPIFRSVEVITNDAPINDWIRGSNSLFLTAAKMMQGKGPWLWLEPDAVPLSTGWLKKIAEDYTLGGKPFMGQIYHWPNFEKPDTGAKLMSGIAIYPDDTFERLHKVLESNPTLAFDVSTKALTVPECHHTFLIQHRYGGLKTPPTFAKNKSDGVFTLDDLKPEAVIFHRVKDGSLIRLLEEKLFHVESSIIVVFPVCQMDYELALHHAQWLASMNRQWNHDAVISFDRSLSTPLNLQTLLRRCFRSVTFCEYPSPKHKSWPQAPNWAMQHTARYMARFGKPWLWLEADAVVLKNDWLDQLQREYDRAGQPFMGPIVPNMGHCNGVAVYPANFAQISPRAMTCIDRAWDYEMKPDMIHKCHDSSRLTQHLWGIVNGQPHPNSGPAPMGLTRTQAKAWIDPSAVLVHRIKDDSLLKLLPL